MLSKQLIEEPGYTRNDLTKENKLIMQGADMLFDRIKDYIENMDPAETLLEKLKLEIEQEALEYFLSYIDREKADLQIWLIESQTEKLLEDIKEVEEKNNERK